jgi:hypothetical protein
MTLYPQERNHQSTFLPRFGAGRDIKPGDLGTSPDLGCNAALSPKHYHTLSMPPRRPSLQAGMSEDLKNSQIDFDNFLASSQD